VSETQKTKNRQGRQILPPQPVQASTEERREQILQKWQTYGKWNINPSEEARRYGVTRAVIHQDLKAVEPHITLVDGEEVRFECARGYKTVFQEASLGVVNRDLKETDRQGWARVLRDASDSMMQFVASNKGSSNAHVLEVVAKILQASGRYDLIEKIADELSGMRLVVGDSSSGAEGVESDEDDQD
jgi:hypothetical protein